jgi:DNA processing protein
MTSSRGTVLSPAAKVAWLRLIRTDNVGPVTFRQLLNRAGSAEAAIEQLPRLASRVGIGAKVPSVTQAEDEIAGLAKLGARLIAASEPDYPPLLNFISGAPPLIAVRGTGKSVNPARTAAIVGARNASAAGQRMTSILASGLGGAGFTVVSGLARGIDAAAHRAALQTGTIAVLAGGIDKIYPDENIPLAEEIVDSGGLMLTEMPLGWQARAQDFPRRNRLVSGLSLGVVVVEAAKRSGSLITARLALEQNREVFAVPGSPLDQRSEGANHLIQEGAKLVTSAQDIIESLAEADPSRTSLLEPDWEPDLAVTFIDAEPSGDERARLIEALSPTPTQVDVIISATGLSVTAVQTLLLELDLAGRLEWSAGQLVALRP